MPDGTVRKQIIRVHDAPPQPHPDDPFFELHRRRGFSMPTRPPTNQQRRAQQRQGTPEESDGRIPSSRNTNRKGSVPPRKSPEPEPKREKQPEPQPKRSEPFKRAASPPPKDDGQDPKATTSSSTKFKIHRQGGSVKPNNANAPRGSRVFQPKPPTSGNAPRFTVRKPTNGSRAAPPK